MIKQELHEYLMKIIEVGKNGECPEELLQYFIKDYPHTKGAYLRHTVWAQSVPMNRLPDLIKGCHLIELKYRQISGNDFGFGGTGRTSILIHELEKRDSNEAAKLREWIAETGGDYFFPPINSSK